MAKNGNPRPNLAPGKRATARRGKRCTSKPNGLIREEWGENRQKLPLRIARELGERARQAPEVARLWDEIGENPAQNASAENEETRWNPADLALYMWRGYIEDYNPSGPKQLVAQRVRPVLQSWLDAALDLERPQAERERLARRLWNGHSLHYYGDPKDVENLTKALPALLLRTKAPLLEGLRALVARGETENYFRQNATSEALWLALAQIVGNATAPRHNYETNRTEVPGADPTILRALTADFPDEISQSNPFGWGLNQLREHADSIEAARAGETVKTETAQSPEAATFEEAPFVLNHQSALSKAQLVEIFGGDDDERFWMEFDAEKERRAQERASEQTALVQQEIIALNDEARVARLVNAPHPRQSGQTIARFDYWQLWARATDESVLKIELAPRVEPLLWARFEEQLETHRQTKSDPIEADIEAKLTARESREWRAQERREKRESLQTDALDAARFLIFLGGFEAHARAIQMADRPHCRDISAQLQSELLLQLEAYPGQHSYALWPLGFAARRYETVVYQDAKSLEAAWRNWKLDEKWDAILAQGEARLDKIKDSWERAALERQLAAGFYRRGDFAKFESYARRSLPESVAHAALFFDDFAAWQLLIGEGEIWQGPLYAFWQAQQSDETKRARAVAAATAIVATMNSEAAARSLLKWLEPLGAVEFEPLVGAVEDALESALVPVKKWAMKTLATFAVEFDCERAAHSAGEMLWSENLGLAKDAVKFLSIVGIDDLNVAGVAWDALCDATALENIGLCEAVYRALVKIKSKRKSLELSEAAREKLELLSAAQNERFGKFGAKL